MENLILTGYIKCTTQGPATSEREWKDFRRNQKLSPNQKTSDKHLLLFKILRRSVNQVIDEPRIKINQSIKTQEIH